MNDKEKQAHWLIKYYSQVADGGEMKWEHGEYLGGPNLDSKPEDWHIKPTPKIIDMSVCIESGIDCEFSDSETCEPPVIGKLHSIKENYNVRLGYSYNQCQPRMSPFIHYWQGGKSPLPEGVNFIPYYRDGGRGKITSTGRWLHDFDELDIIGFEVMPEPTEGYTYEQ